MNRLTHARAALFFAAFTGAGIAGAATISECTADVLLARGSIDAAQTFANPNDQAALHAKADGAVEKLDLGKFEGAALLLSDMNAKVVSLAGAAKPKLGAAEGAALSAEIQAAQACVAQLMAQ